MKAHIKKTYGLTVEQHDEMFERQANKCLGCGRHQKELKRRLDVDHCHKTGKIRGLLCMNCNRTLGYAKDSPLILRSLAAYIESHT